MPERLRATQSYRLADQAFDMARICWNSALLSGDTDRRKRGKRRWPRILLAFLVLMALVAVVLFALGWLSFDFTGGDIDAPSVEVDTNLPDVDVDPGELPDVDVENEPSN